MLGSHARSNPRGRLLKVSRFEQGLAVGPHLRRRPVASSRGFAQPVRMRLDARLRRMHAVSMALSVTEDSYADLLQATISREVLNALR
jgi:hypothetical protein